VGREREYPRVTVQGCEGVLRGSVSVTLLDVSLRGLKLETRSLVRPGTKCELKANLGGHRLECQVLITRCSASGTVPDGRGGRVLVYRAGASIVGMDSGRADELSAWLERQAEDAHGSSDLRGARAS
jgi:hypothetical protein